MKAAVLLPLFAVTLPAAGPLILADHGRSSYSICLSAEASPSEKRGAAEFERFIEEMSGARLPIATETCGGGGDLVLIGKSSVLDKLKPGITFDKLGAEGFALRTVGKHLVIAGGRQRGTMYGVYSFLEKLGCRWFTAEVSRIPWMNTIRVPKADEIQMPAFDYRQVYSTEAFDKDWSARNKQNGQFSKLDESTGGRIEYYPYVHSFAQLVPPDEYFRDHPEYFSLIAGKRRAKRSQLCLTNREVLRIATEKVLTWIHEHPDATIFSVSQNDYTGWCECDQCKRVEEEEGGAHSGPLLRFVNAIAEEVGNKYPDKLIDTLAYWYTEAPPAKSRPRSNVRIRLCPIGACEAHPYEKCDRSAYFMNHLREWAKLTDKLYIWHYNTNFTHQLLPFPDFDELAADIPMYKRYGVVGLFMQGFDAPPGSFELSELRDYVMARLLWDVKTDVNCDIDEFLNGVYGRAAKHMRQYLDLIEEQVRLPPAGLGHHLWIYDQPGSPYLSEAFLSRAKAIFRDAQQAAAGDAAVRRRVDRASLSIKYAEVQQAKRFVVHDGTYAPGNLPGLEQRFPAFMAELRAAGATRLHEGSEIAWDEATFADRIKPYEVRTLENSSLVADIVPELQGRVIRLIDKRTGKDLLHSPDPGETTYPDMSGMAAYFYPDYETRAIEAEWELAQPPGSQDLFLKGVNEIGLELWLWISLDGRSLRTVATASNTSETPKPVAILSWTDFDLGHPEDPRMALVYKSGAGNPVDRTLFQPGLETEGWENRASANCPNGEWSVFHRAGGPRMVGRFATDQVARCIVSWTVQGENRASLALWSSERTLAPGESLQLESGYTIE